MHLISLTAETYNIVNVLSTKIESHQNIQTNTNGNGNMGTGTGTGTETDEIQWQHQAFINIVF